MIKKILLTFLILVAALVGYASMQPSEFTVSRSTVINAPVEQVFPHVNNLHNWNAWSPWAKMDPNAKATFTGAEEGIGAVMSWAGNFDVGEGSMTISDSKPNASIDINLAFIQPMKGEATSAFKFESQEKQTKVTWSMVGKKDLMGKLMGLVMDCHKMMEQTYDKGLANLKAVVEQEATTEKH